MSGTSSANFQGLPQSKVPVLSASGGMNDAWYRFMQTLWLQTASGTPNSVTLQGVYTIGQGAQQSATSAQTAAAAAQTSADTANSAVAAETARAEAAEANLQGQINTINGTLTSLQNQINTINTRLANAGIP